MLKGTNDGLFVDAALLLNYSRVNLEVYRSVGIEEGFVRREPFFNWLPAALESDLEDASAIQATRDARLAERLFDFKKGKVWEQPILDLVHLFIEAHRQVHVVSHESPDALDAVLARAGLPQSVRRHPLVAVEQRVELIEQILRDESCPDWLAVYDWGLTRALERRTIETLAGRGVLVNVNEPTNRTADERLLKVFEDRWLT